MPLIRRLIIKVFQKLLMMIFGREKVPIITPVWDTPKDRLELFVYKEDKTCLVQRNKYVRNFKTKEGNWVSYEFDPDAIHDFSSVDDLYDSISEKFIQYKEIGEEEYEEHSNNSLEQMLH